jgi:uncharacterized protein
MDTSEPRLPRRAFLGAELPADIEAFTPEGVAIAGVVPGSMAERAGLASGDVLRALSGHAVRTLPELARGLRAAGASSTTRIEFVRGGERIERVVEVTPHPCETIEAARVEYGEHAATAARLRTIRTRGARPRALIAFVQGIACESIDHGASPDAPLAGLVAGWAAAGLDTLRFDKRGVGDSEGGPCPQTDFATELADAEAVLRRARIDASELGVPLVVFGHSVGGIIAALAARSAGADAVIVYGTPVMRWIACLKDSTTRQLALHGADAATIDAQVRALDELATRGELNGRSAAYHAQLEQHDLEAAWRQVDAPVLVVRGEHDWVVDADDQARIATLARGATTVVDVPGLDHLFGGHADRDASLRDYGAGAFDPALALATIEWLERARLV